MNRIKIYTLLLWGALVCGAFTGCGRVMNNDYESMMNSDQFNPTVAAQESVTREKSFAHDLCLPEDTKAAGNPDFSLPTAGLFALGSRSTIYGSGLTTRVFPASTTKLMTALVAVKHGKRRLSRRRRPAACP